MSELTPPVALRTYLGLRVGVVAVILALMVAVGWEIAEQPDNCVQRSLSAYYYTPVRPVFVGALLIIGFAMIAMWGKTVVEDAALNLAGLLLIVVALVPTLDANFCSLPPELRAEVPDPERKQVADNDLILSNADAVNRSFTAFLVVLGVLLLFIAILGLRTFLDPDAQQPTHVGALAYVVTWGIAVLAFVVYLALFAGADDPGSVFNHEVHSWSANVGVGFIIVAVLAAAAEYARSDDRSRPWWRRWRPRQEWNRWVWIYGVLALVMILTAAVIKLGDAAGLFSGFVDIHATFVLEAILIVLLGVYWALQTIERRGAGAPSY